MDKEEFLKRGLEMIDYVVDYLESLSQRPVTPNVPPDYLISASPSEPPKTGESFEKIMNDIEQYIMPGLIHWQHPGFHGFFPASPSFPSILANMMADVLGYVSFNKDLCPCGSDLEVLVLNWYGELIGLPKCFLRIPFHESRSSGLLYRSSSESIFVSMITARRKILRNLTQKNPSIPKAALLSSLVAYCSKEADSCLEKFALAALVNIRVLGTDDNYRLRGETLVKALSEDKKVGLIPFFVIITLGSPSCCSCDPIDEIGLICKEHDIWLHVDAAHAGNAMVCPEYRYLLKGVEYASSFHSNPSNWMLMHFDCSVLFVKDRFLIREAMVVDRVNTTGYGFSEKDWGYANKSEFRALKLFFVMRNYGVEGIQKHIRKHVSLAEKFADEVKSDQRFELVYTQFALVCFRLKGSNATNKNLRTSIIKSGKIFVTPCTLHGKYVIRFAIGTERANEEDIIYAWKVICEHAEKVLKHDCRRELSEDPSEIFEEYYKFGLP